MREQVHRESRILQKMVSISVHSVGSAKASPPLVHDLGGSWAEGILPVLSVFGGFSMSDLHGEGLVVEVTILGVDSPGGGVVEGLHEAGVFQLLEVPDV